MNPVCHLKKRSKWLVVLKPSSEAVKAMDFEMSKSFSLAVQESSEAMRSSADKPVCLKIKSSKYWWSMTSLSANQYAESMTYLAVKGQEDNEFRVFFDRIIVQGMSDKIRWDNGLVIYDNQFECMFYDLIEYKVKCEDKKAVYPIPNIFYFNRKGINKKSFFKLFYYKIINQWKKNKNSGEIAA